MKTQALGDLRKEKKTRKLELQLLWACFLLGLWGQQKTRTSLKSFNTTDVAAITEKKAVGWLCCKHNSDRAEDCGVWADTSSYKREACLCEQGTAPPPGNRKPVQGPENPNTLKQGWERQAGFQAGQKRREGTPWNKILPLSL